jgi:hypothetical protein
VRTPEAFKFAGKIDIRALLCHFPRFVVRTKGEILSVDDATAANAER